MADAGLSNAERPGEVKLHQPFNIFRGWLQWIQLFRVMSDQSHMTKIVPGRSCGDCSKCCKIMRVDGVETPAHLVPALRSGARQVHHSRDWSFRVPGLLLRLVFKFGHGARVAAVDL